MATPQWSLPEAIYTIKDLACAFVDGEAVCFEDERALGAYMFKRLPPDVVHFCEVLFSENSGMVRSCMLRNSQAAMLQRREPCVM